ncbi:hypothetical protein DCAR_0831533 [Daucus carota subsp. sativus]|uniref:Uncharacterized protein n=1 Tax=Daucus carota subsp. sativus TaxID=79200 RepID=A0A175YPA8_DAUCS|nr:PREDICTED: uncharacterized protein LOC108198278 [Daucus carota subsp. sativus]WOH12036.1 hypothetical protein DCAR_0831533 [Daucus carota subsp. sativus]
MSSELIASHREGAIVVTGEEAIKQKAAELTKNAFLPSGLIPLGEIVEIGHNPTTGFFWTLRKKKLEHFNKKINKKSTFDTEVTAFIEERRMRKVTGVKSKELMLWVSITDIRIDDPASGKIIFTATAGITKTFLVSAFEDEEEEKKVEVEVEAETVEAVKEVSEPEKEEAEVKKVEEVEKVVEVKN